MWCQLREGTKFHCSCWFAQISGARDELSANSASKTYLLPCGEALKEIVLLTAWNCLIRMISGLTFLHNLLRAKRLLHYHWIIHLMNLWSSRVTFHLNISESTSTFPFSLCGIWNEVAVVDGNTRLFIKLCFSRGGTSPDVPPALKVAWELTAEATVKWTKI